MNTAPPPQEQRQTAAAIKTAPDGAVHLTAKGQGVMAEEILDIAFSSGTKVRQDPDLARMLQSFETGTPLPPPALEALSALLSYLYSYNQAVAQDGHEDKTDSTEDIGDSHGPV